MRRLLAISSSMFVLAIVSACALRRGAFVYVDPSPAILMRASDDLGVRQVFYENSLNSVASTNSLDLSNKQLAELQHVLSQGVTEAVQRLDQVRDSIHLPFGAQDRLSLPLNAMKQICESQEPKLLTVTLVKRDDFTDGIRECYGTGRAGLVYLASGDQSLPMISVRTGAITGVPVVAKTDTGEIRKAGTTVFDYAPKEAAIYSLEVGDPGNRDSQVGVLRIYTLTRSPEIIVNCELRKTENFQAVTDGKSKAAQVSLAGQRWYCIPTDAREFAALYQ